MKKINSLALLLVGLIFCSCASSPLPSQYKGYSKLNEGVYYKFLDKQGNEKPPQAGDVCRFHSSILKNDLLLSSSYQGDGATDLPITDDEFQPPAQRVLQLMSEGDSLSLVVVVDSLEQMPNGFVTGEWMEMKIKLLEIITQEERANVVTNTLDDLEKHPNGQFYWKKHQFTDGRKATGGDEVQFNLTLRNVEKVVYKTRNQLPDLINIPFDEKNISPLHIVMQELSAGDSVTVAFEVADMSNDFKKIVKRDGFFDGDLMVMDVGIISIRDTATLNKAKREARRKQIQDQKDAIALGKNLDKILPKRIKQYKAKQIKNLITTESGLKYVVHKKGNGPVLSKGQVVYVHYSGYLTNQEKKFEASFDKGFAINFGVGQGNVIKGWDEAMTTLPVGTKATLFIPYHLAYGEQGRPDKIPPYANLTFYIEILDYR